MVLSCVGLRIILGPGSWDCFCACCWMIALCEIRRNRRTAGFWEELLSASDKGLFLITYKPGRIVYCMLLVGKGNENDQPITAPKNEKRGYNAG